MFKRLKRYWKQLRYKKVMRFYNRRLETMPKKYKYDVWMKGKSPLKEYWVKDKFDLTE